MPSLPKREWFLTISPPDASTHHENLRVAICAYIQQGRFTQYVLIEENGKQGSHIHWHAYVASPTPLYKSSLERDLDPLISKHVSVSTERRLVCQVKPVSDKHGLIAGYFTKEDGRTIVAIKDIDMEASSQVMVARGEPIVSLSEAKPTIPMCKAPYAILEYGARMGTDMFCRRNVLNVIHKLSEAGYNVSNLCYNVKSITTACQVISGRCDLAEHHLYSRD